MNKKLGTKTILAATDGDLLKFYDNSAWLNWADWKNLVSIPEVYKRF